MTTTTSLQDWLTLAIMHAEETLTDLRAKLADPEVSLSYTLRWNAEDCIKAEQELMWLTRIASSLKAAEDPQACLADWREELTDSVMRWEPCRSTCPMTRLEEEVALKVQKDVLRRLPKAIEIA